MPEIFSDEIIGKMAMTSGGYPVGEILDIVAETDTGELKYLIVRPSGAQTNATKKVDEKGNTVVSFTSLKVTDDNVIVL